MVAEVVKGELGFSSPWILPGGKAVLFTRYTAPSADAARIEVLTLADHRRRIVIPGGNSARYLPASNGTSSNGAGNLIYVNKATLFAVPFDRQTVPQTLTASRSRAMRLRGAQESPAQDSEIYCTATVA
jgi:hypothetical protein